MQLNIPYIPIVIDFIPAVSSPDSSVSLLYNSYKMLIRQEASNNASSWQCLPQDYIVTIPPEGVVRLKLLHLEAGSSKQSPINRYRVYYYVGEELLDTQFWRVPPWLPNSQTLTLHNDGTETPIELPPTVFEITSISPASEYILAGNFITFPATDPIGNYTLNYQPGLTLYDIVVEK